MDAQETHAKIFSTENTEEQCSRRFSQKTQIKIGAGEDTCPYVISGSAYLVARAGSR
jgi:hypothetical protein